MQLVIFSACPKGRFLKGSKIRYTFDEQIVSKVVRCCILTLSIFPRNLFNYSSRTAQDLPLFHPFFILSFKVSSPCTVNNGGCSHFCVPKTSGYECVCPTGLTVKQDGKTCNESKCIFSGTEKGWIPFQKWTKSMYKHRVSSLTVKGRLCCPAVISPRIYNTLKFLWISLCLKNKHCELRSNTRSFRNSLPSWSFLYRRTGERQSWNTSVKCYSSYIIFCDRGMNIWLSLDSVVVGTSTNCFFFYGASQRF